jgi:hypothetical protein
MAESSELNRLRERKLALVGLAEAQRTLLTLEWNQLKAQGSQLAAGPRWSGKMVPLIGAAAAGLGFLGATRLGVVMRILTRGVAAWQFYRQMRGLWQAFAQPASSRPEN